MYQGIGPRRAARGFTLVELMIVALLFLILAGVVLTMLVTGQTSFVSSDAYILVQQESRRAFDNVVRELRESGTISCGPPDCSGRLNFQIARAYDPTDPNADPTTGIVWGSDVTAGDYVHYVMTTVGNTSQLFRCVSGAAGTDLSGSYGACRVLANYVDTANSSFVWNPTDQTVTLNLRIDYRHPVLPGGGQSMPTLSSQIKLRN